MGPTLVLFGTPSLGTRKYAPGMLKATSQFASLVGLDLYQCEQSELRSHVICISSGASDSTNDDSD